jgi:hypothetical protein
VRPTGLGLVSPHRARPGGGWVWRLQRTGHRRSSPPSLPRWEEVLVEFELSNRLPPGQARRGERVAAARFVVVKPVSTGTSPVGLHREVIRRPSLGPLCQTLVETCVAAERGACNAMQRGGGGHLSCALRAERTRYAIRRPRGRLSPNIWPSSSSRNWPPSRTSSIRCGGDCCTASQSSTSRRTAAETSR